MADDGVFRSGIMLRIGKTEDIERQYEDGYLKFSCPGNWIMYAKKNHDDGIADKYEAIFAHVKRDDPRLLEACNNGPYPYKALFRKRPEFRDQREARLVIPGVNYLRHPKVRPDEFHDHELKVSVPHLQEYSAIVPASKCKRIRFENFNEDLSRYDILFRDKE